MKTLHLLLVDASGFAYRSFYASHPVYRESDGEPIGAVLGFLGMIWRLLGAAQADQPTHAAAVFDHPGPTFRHKLFPEYKTNRALARARQEELKTQLPVMRIAAQALGLTPVEVAGFEGDDVIATLSTRAVQDGMRVSIVSSDKDFCSLVSDGKIEIIDPVAHVRIREADVRGRKFGVHPKQVPDVQALAGDPVDNIPGIEGIGLKSAAAFIRNFDTVEGVIAAARARNPIISASQRLKLAGKVQTLQLYRELARLRTDVPIAIDWAALELQPIYRAHIEKMLKVLEAERRFEAIFATEPKMQRVVEPIAGGDHFEWWREELLAPGQQLWDLPQCGFYQRRLVKGGIFVPARIWREPELDPITHAETGMDILRCEIGGRAADPVQEWEKLARNPISREKYEFEMADQGWARKYAPKDPKATPEKPINLLAQPAPHCPKTSKRRKRVRT